MTDTFEQIVNQVQQQVDNFHIIKYKNQECRLFKSLSNRRLIESGETFDEYKLRLKINAKMIKQQKKGTYERAN